MFYNIAFVSRNLILTIFRIFIFLYVNFSESN